MKRSAIVAGGAGLGFGLMYFLDPTLGRRRRALVRDRAVWLARDSREMLEGASRDIVNRAQGLRHAGSQLLSRGQADDRVLEQRVRAKLGRASSHPSAIQVAVENGIATLRGAVLEHELNDILAAVSGVRGIREVRNELEAHREAGGISALQGAGRRPGRRLRVTPASRVAAALTGAGLLAYGLRRRKLLGTAAGLAGAALMAGGFSARGLRRMAQRATAGAGGAAQPQPQAPGAQAQAPQPEAQPVSLRQFDRKLGIDATPDRVFRFLSSVHNLQQFLPWIREIRQEPEDHVWGIAEERGERRELNGFFRPTEESRRIDWGSDGAPIYRGWLEVAEAGGNSELTIHLEYEGVHIMDQMVDDVLNSIRQLVEQQGAGGVIGEERRAA